MPIYKCPQCGRSNIDLPQVQAVDSEALLTTLPNVQPQAHCKECGWTGSADDLKASY